ncbi:hypothetical protein Bpfe_013444 [Biomphalaria pfeifferi]|uniref:YDG domain-containing protein n=1 Tax=Biomphalaria pfeifferi TaxID=112525 RepID=A0AAD8FAB8_BIOPF|nr:hypothetical protein Bpfe_013444 [Biomphalaria pfeifferi]
MAKRASNILVSYTVITGNYIDQQENGELQIQTGKRGTTETNRQQGTTKTDRKTGNCRDQQENRKLQKPSGKQGTIETYRGNRDLQRPTGISGTYRDRQG